VAAIYIADCEGNHIERRSGVSRDLRRTMLELRRQHLAWRLSWASWVDDADIARRILTASCGPSIQAIAEAAQRMGVQMTPHSVVMQRVRIAVTEVQKIIEAANASGELSWFNRGFREWRLEAKQHGRYMSYAEARARLRRVVFVAVLQGDVTSFGAALLPKIFPLLPGQHR
jgi:hypothetical protein